MKDNLEYFTHDADAFDHPKHQALIAVYGFEGYGRFWILNEFIGKAARCMLDISKKRNKATIANKLHMSLSEFDEFIEFLADDEECGLIKIQDGIVWTERTQEDLERVMHTRKRQADYRSKTNGDSNGSVPERFQNESKTLRNESESLHNKNHRAEQSRQEQSRVEQSRADTPPVDNSETETHDVSPEEVRAAAADVLDLRLRDADARAATKNLSAHKLDAAFVRWAAEEVKKRENIKSPPGFLKKMLLDLDEYTDMIERYREKPAPHAAPSRASPPAATCPHCSGKVREIGGEIWCNGCKRLLWEYDEDFDIWSEPAEAVDASGW